MTESEPIWLKLEFILKLHSRQLAEHGGSDGIRDEGMLVSALNRPADKWHYADPKPDLCELAAAYAFGFAKNHPFIDGNKRTSAMACETFLVRNGLLPTASEDEKYPYYLSLASGDVSETDFASWLRENTAPIE
ncbi:death-on-curing protein [Haloferula helveola]|uniref:Death-on-curing protein n=1 Tax=Haloferula helveola TaxID=490095 RepID=A0ABN6GYJ7_9BACT|nr:death-on-curing protein [Haloferula helveola]